MVPIQQSGGCYVLTYGVLSLAVLIVCACVHTSRVVWKQVVIGYVQYVACVCIAISYSAACRWTEVSRHHNDTEVLILSYATDPAQ